MPANVKIKLSIKKYPQKVKEEFARLAGNDTTIVAAIKDLISKGISPVFGIGRFQKYSESYIGQMKGEVSFFTKKGTTTLKVGQGFFGQIVPMKPGKGQLLDTIPRRYGKKPRPVNLFLSGDMLDSLRLLKNGLTPKLIFDDPKAVFHNEKGAGRSKVIRRMLPTYRGELFSSVVQKKITDLVNQATRRASNK